MSYTIYCGNNRDFYSRIPTVQAVITDPPYGAEVHSKDKVGRDLSGTVTSVPIPFDQLTNQDSTCLGEFLRDRVEGWSLVFCQTEQINEWRSELEGERCRYYRPMMWIKTNARPNFSGNGPGVGHETIQAYWCGVAKQKWNGGGALGVFHHYNRFREGAHPTEKPVSLMKDLVRYFTNPGDTIFDPFMGAGATGVAALELGRNFIGIEQNETYYAEAERRLIEASRPGLVIPESQEKMPTLMGDAAFGSIGTRRRLEREAKEKEDADQ